MTKMTDIPVMPVDEAVDMLSSAYVKILRQDLSPYVLPSVMLWGPPGVGKSQAVRQIAHRISEDCGKKVNVTDVRLILFNPIDLRGIPVSNEDRTLAVWLKPKIFQMDESPDTVNILFLDEVSAAPQSVQAAAYQITLDRVIGEHRLPDNCIVIAAGNRVTDKSVAYKMPRALANRLMHIEIESGFESWRNWAERNGINPNVIGYLSFRHDFLFLEDVPDDALAFPTPRSWEMVSRILNCVDNDPNKMYPMISGLIGESAAREFKIWCGMHTGLPSMEDIFSGKHCPVPQRPDLIYALVSSMASYASEHRYDPVAIGNSLVYAANLPADYQQLLISKYMLFSDDYHHFLTGIPEYSLYSARTGVQRNGSVQ